MNNISDKKIEYSFYFFLVVFLMSLNSCRKDDLTPPPSVQILSPTENQIILLPGELKIHLKIKSEKSIKFVQVSFVNFDDAQIFKPQLYYPDTTSVEIDESIYLGLLPQGFFDPFFVHITVIGGAGTHSYYQQVDLINPDLKYKGFYVATRPSIGSTEVYFYDQGYNESLFTSVNGEFFGSTSSDYQDFYYLTTRIPSKIYAYTYEDSQLIWEKSAELPIPEFTSMRFKSNFMFTGTANGRIRSFNAVTGNPDVVTSQMVDSIPLHVQASSDHIVGEFLSKSNNSNMLVLFYRHTGTLVRKRPLNFAVADIFAGKYGYNFVVFGNELNTSLCATYQPLGNLFIDTKIIDEGNIKQVVEFNPDQFFLDIGNSIYLFDYSTGTNKLVLEFLDEVVQFRYDPINGRLLVAFENRVEIYNYPGNDLIHSQIIPNAVNSIDLRFTF